MNYDAITHERVVVVGGMRLGPNGRAIPRALAEYPLGKRRGKWRVPIFANTPCEEPTPQKKEELGRERKMREESE